MNIIEQVKNYKPYNKQEIKDKEYILYQLLNCKDIFYRENLDQHMTASCWIVNKQRTKILLAYHNIFKSYAWLGGHADGEEDLIRVSLKEGKEESGLFSLKLLSNDIFSLEVLDVEPHYKKGKLVKKHLHLNVTYLIEADENENLIVKEDENSSLKWFDIDSSLDYVNEKWMKENIYSKLNSKLKEFIKNENN
jgi:hypothetical protein